MAVGTADPVRTLYRTLLAYVVVGVLILVAGVAEYVNFEPFVANATAQARVSGVYLYDPTSETTKGVDRDTFKRSDQFAAVVDWTGLPDAITVQAVWYDSFENIVGRVGPATPIDLRDETIVPAVVPVGLKYHLPGQYIFVIERVDNGRPVEVLGRRVVYVERI